MRSLVLLAAWLIPLGTAAQDAPADRLGADALAAHIESGAAETEDLRMQLRFRQNERGVVRVHTFDDGPTIFASVVGGRPVDYLAIDAEGRAVPLAEATTTYGGETSFWRCVPSGTHCWQVTTGTAPSEG